MLFIFASLVILSISAFGQVGGYSTYSTPPSSSASYSSSSTANAREYKNYSTTSQSSDSCKCGIKNTGRIVSGTEAKMHEYPWQAMIQIDNFSSLCGGTLISSNYVLTASHCVDGKTKDNLLVSLGDHDMNTGSGTDGTIHVKVAEIIMHESYDSKSIDNDITLLKLANPIKFTNAISPACLPYGIDSNALTGKTGTVTGWGATSDGGDSSQTLLEVNLPLLTTEGCQKYYGTSNITNNMICTYLPGKDSCQGDSGGPLVLEENGSNKVIGVVSWGVGCAKEGNPGVYAKVTNYLDWIQKKTGETFCKP